jgi:hypothetical protein
VPQSPHRPFVPHRTPNKARVMPGTPEFRLARPFVPGGLRAAVTQLETRDTESAVPVEISLPDIRQFLQVEAPPAQSAAAYADDSASTDFEEPEELPPVEHFLDPLPPVDHFTSDEFPTSYSESRRGNGSPPSEELPPAGDSGWLETDWQKYDWRGAAALGETAAVEASNAWATTDWDASSPRPNAPQPSAAQAIATALDQIAQRIRDGQLVVPSPGAVADPATIAATLASLLGIRP